LHEKAVLCRGAEHTYYFATVHYAEASTPLTSAIAATDLALISYQLLALTTPIWVLAAAFFLQGAGMGLVMPPATESVMSVVPRERAGAGSALTNTARQVSGALGVAVLGSVLAQVYRNQLTPHLANLPAAARDAATGSITASQAVAARIGPAGQELARFADASFVHAMHITTLISAMITLLGALVVMRWMPGRAAAVRPVPATGTATAAPAAARVREPVPAMGASLAQAAPVNGEGPPEGAAALDEMAALDGAAPANGAASRNGPGAADGAAGPGGSIAMEG